MNGRRSFWRQFSLRGLLILVTLAAVFLGWFAWRLRMARVQDAAAESIVRAGGEVAYSDQFYGGVSRLTPRHRQANMLGDISRRLLGGDPTRKLVSVRLIDDESAALVAKYDLRDLTIVRLDGGKAITDAALAHLANCEQLRVLYLEDGNLTDRGIEGIGQHSKLEELWLCNTQITDAALDYLIELPVLRVLDIRGTVISDEGLKRIAAMPNLRMLYLDSATVTDSGIQSLHASKRLMGLWLGDLSSANLDLVAIAAIPQLEQIYLKGPLITDDRLAVLKNNTKIQRLNVQRCTGLTDESLKTLATMPNLKSLGIISTPFTAQGIGQFKSDRPDCNVW